MANPTFSWSISEKQKSEAILQFQSLNSNLVGGDAIKQLFSSAVEILPNEELIKIWHLSDVDQDGFLNETEFVLFHFLITAKLIPIDIPLQLPESLWRSIIDTSMQPPPSSVNEAEPAAENKIIQPKEVIQQQYSASLDFDNVDAFFEIPPINTIQPFEKYKILAPNPSLSELAATYGISQEVTPRYDVAIEIAKVGLMNTISPQYMSECENIFQKQHSQLTEQGQLHSKIVEHGKKVHEELLRIEKQAVDCYNYMGHQFSELVLAEARLKEAKGDIHALIHVAKHEVSDKPTVSILGHDEEYNHLLKEKKRLAALLKIIDV